MVGLLEPLGFSSPPSGEHGSVHRRGFVVSLLLNGERVEGRGGDHEKQAFLNPFIVGKIVF